jgi:hypothetical protein
VEEESESKSMAQVLGETVRGWGRDCWDS